MDIESAKDIFFECFSIPVEVRHKFLIQKRKDLDCDPDLYYSLLRKVTDYFYTIQIKEIRKEKHIGNEIDDYGIPLDRITPYWHLFTFGSLFLADVLSFKEVLKKSLEHEIEWINSQLKKSKKKEPVKNELTFEKLFFKPEYANKVKELFERNDYTKKGKWIAPGNKKKLATAFFVLKDPYPEICVIRPGKNTTQLTVFYKEFGLIVAVRGGDVTIRNISIRPQYDITEKTDYKEFVALFEPLKKKK